MMEKSRIPMARDFYVQHLGFQIVFEADWYVSLKMADHPHAYELALLDYTHETIPSAFRKPVQGLLLNFEVEDVDATYHRLIDEAGLTVVQALRSETFGQRHFIIEDPAGVLIDIITPIPPEESPADNETL